MPNIGPLELAIVAIIALIIFGPKRLPELGRSLGDGMREFKSSISGEDRDDDEDEDDDITVIENGEDEDDGDDHPAEAEPPSANESESPETAERTPS